MISPARAYILGAAFGATILENMFRPGFISGFNNLVKQPLAKQQIHLLLDWAPEKMFDLVKDIGIPLSMVSDWLGIAAESDKQKRYRDILIHDCSKVNISHRVILKWRQCSSWRVVWGRILLVTLCRVFMPHVYQSFWRITRSCWKIVQWRTQRPQESRKSELRVQYLLLLYFIG